jgi:hypothetical protein
MLSSRPLRLALVLALALSGGCASWRAVEVTDSWTLYASPEVDVDPAPYGRSLEPAFAAIEERLGPFTGRVRVHVWSGEDPGVPLPGHTEVQEVPGIGPARVRAFHVRGGANPFAADGIFLGTTEVGTVVHELVHARLAEEPGRVPLWFEEGLGSLLGDGCLYDGRWVVDGLACWPLRELRQQRLSDADLERLLALRPSDQPDPRDNLLVHFVGWSIVFDLSEELPEASWQEWLAAFERGAEAEGRVAHARRRMERTLRSGRELEWLERLASPDPAVRLAAAKGTWKLRSREAIDLLLDALEHEQQAEVRYALALNVFLASPETRLGRSRWNRIRRQALPVLRAAELGDPVAAEAAQAFFRSVFGGGRRGRSQEQLDLLTRYWNE